MFQERVITELKKVIGFQDHWNLTDIPALPASLTESQSGQYFQDFHPLVRLDYIEALLPSDRTLEEFLDDIETKGIKQMLNQLTTFKKINNSGNELVKNTLIYDNVLKNKPIVNEGRFVGIQFNMKPDAAGLKAVINRIGLYLTAAQPSLTLYLFNSMQATAVQTFTFTSASANSFTWLNEEITITQNNGADTDGGVWYLGYYQDDLVGNAIQYDALNWRVGACYHCDRGLRDGLYKSIAKYVAMTPFYVPAASLPAVGELFDHEDIVYTELNNYGFNLNMSVFCDLSQFFIDNRMSMVDAIGKMVCLKILQMMKASSQISAIEQNVQINIIRDLEGDRETKATPFHHQVEWAIKSVNLDQGNANTICVPCARRGVSYHAV